MIQEIKINEKTSFIRIMGNSPINRVLDFLIENERTGWTMLEIAKNANVGYSTLKIILPELIDNNLIIIVKEIGKVKLYSINKENLIVKKLYDLHKQITINEIKKLKYS